MRVKLSVRILALSIGLAAAASGLTVSQASAQVQDHPCSGYRVNQTTGESRCKPGTWGISHRVLINCLNPRTGDHVITGPWVGGTSKSRAQCPNWETANDIWTEYGE